ncbi:hypothetical protein NW757_005375 [Fusarium falciforme]|nr:hypothetical protein NW757_005375 [Fusarium falciforme]
MIRQLVAAEIKAPQARLKLGGQGLERGIINLLVPDFQHSQLRQQVPLQERPDGAWGARDVKVHQPAKAFV